MPLRGEAERVRGGETERRGREIVKGTVRDRTWKEDRRENGDKENDNGKKD